MTQPNQRVGMICSRYGCGVVSTELTAMGVMCASHASPLMFAIQRPYELRALADGVPFLVPWEFVCGHDRQARLNHGGQTLARLSERGGLALTELIAVLEGRAWASADMAVSRAQHAVRLQALLTAWHESCA